MVAVEGHVEPAFARLREAFAEAQAQDDGGAQLCVYRDSRKVVDLWAGRDPVNNRSYTDRTITVLMSCSKGAVATMAHMLAERGRLDLDAPVARYWPEFAQGNKEAVTVSDLLAHRAGLSGFTPESGIGPKQLLDWAACTSALAAMTPLWEPGTAYLYHALTFGYLAGELIRRVSGKTPGRFFADEIACPLGLHLWIGLPESEEPNVAPHFTTRPELSLEQWTALLTGFGIRIETALAQTMMRMVTDLPGGIVLLNSRAAHAAEIPAGNAIGDAASLAKMYAALIGEVDGVRLLRRETMERARQPQTDGLPAPGDFAKLPAPDPQRLALGYELNRGVEPMLGPGSFGHAGAGGRMGFAHPESRVAVGYACNAMVWDGVSGPDPRWLAWTQALRDVLGL